MRGKVEGIAQRVPPDFLDRFNEHFECWNRGELELMLSMYADDAVFDVSAVFTDVEPVQGRENMLRYWMELRETWEGIGLEPVEGFEVGDGRFVLVMRMSGVGKRSGAGVDQRIAGLYTVGPEDDKIVHAQFLPDVEAALAAAESSADQPV